MAPKSNTKAAAVKLVYKVDFSKPAGDGQSNLPPFPLPFRSARACLDSLLCYSRTETDFAYRDARFFVRIRSPRRC
jgi:hypothetical protein